MYTEVDPEQRELRELKAAAHWTGSDVLEIGCGDGRLARRLAGLGAAVAAIDPDVELVRSAVGKRTKSPGRRPRYAVADGRQLPFASETFDIVVFGWSL